MSKSLDNAVLITGGAGFIGSNFIPYFLQKNSDLSVVNLDLLTYAANLDHLSELKNNDRYEFVEGDICDTSLLDRLFNEFKISSVIHFAAESHVDNSIERPDHFVKTNIRGTFELLEAARRHWKDSSRNRFHHISTDEVYGSLGDSGYFTEMTPYAPNSPYSASKAASDFLVRSYHHTYGLNTVTSNCSNNFGPKQNDEKLIPTIIRTALQGGKIPIYGDGSNIRDWLFVEDHCKAVELIFHNGKPGETYLIGGNNEYNNLYIARTICKIMDQRIPREKGSFTDQISFVKDRPGHDFRYAIDASKLKSELGWEPQESFDSGLEKTVDWYLTKYRKK